MSLGLCRPALRGQPSARDQPCPTRGCASWPTGHVRRDSCVSRTDPRRVCPVLTLSRTDPESGISTWASSSDAGQPLPAATTTSATRRILRTAWPRTRVSPPRSEATIQSTLCDVGTTRPATVTVGGGVGPQAREPRGLPRQTPRRTPTACRVAAHADRASTPDTSRLTCMTNRASRARRDGNKEVGQQPGAARHGHHGGHAAVRGRDQGHGR